MTTYCYTGTISGPGAGWESDAALETKRKELETAGASNIELKARPTGEITLAFDVDADDELAATNKGRNLVSAVHPAGHTGGVAGPADQPGVRNAAFAD